MTRRCRLLLDLLARQTDEKQKTMSKPEIAPAVLADAQPIAEMSRRLIEAGLPWSWTPARVMRHITHPESVVLAARRHNELAGFAIMHYGDEVAHLNLLGVNVPWQRRGLGRELLRWLESSAMTAGIFLVCLEVRARNANAAAFYRRLGYQEAGRLTRYYAGREDAIRMTRDLRHPAARPGGRVNDSLALHAPEQAADRILQRFRK